MCQKCVQRPPVFKPSNVNATRLKNVIPERLFVPDTPTSLSYLARDVIVTISLASAVWIMEGRLSACHTTSMELRMLVFAVRGIIWCLYWWFQSLAFTALWLIAHECGHGSFSPYSFLNDGVGFVLHSCMGTPYYSWKYTHRQHHRFNGHLEKDEHHIPKVLDTDAAHGDSGLWDIVEDIPLYQLARLLFQQLVGFQSYLLFNISGQSRYPRWTNHYNPYCVLFRRSQRFDIFVSDIGLLTVLGLLVYSSKIPPLSAGYILRLYGVPWILLNHWVAMIVSLQHTDVVLPRYRDGAYTFARGALVTVDREFLGWQGKFFLHCVAHYHVVHHFFPTMPFYHLEEATEYAKKVLGDDYISCDTPVFRALWENHFRCRYVDAKGDVVFYKDKHGSAQFQHSAESEGYAIQ